MEYFVGLLSGVVFFTVLCGVFYLGYRFNKNTPSRVSSDPVTEEEKKKAVAIQKHFSKLMSYDVETALQRMRVDE